MHVNKSRFIDHACICIMHITALCKKNRARVVATVQAECIDERISLRQINDALHALYMCCLVLRNRISLICGLPLALRTHIGCVRNSLPFMNNIS